MTTGMLAALCLFVGQTADNVTYSKDRNLAIPVNIQESRRAEIQELFLFMSPDRGRAWSMASRILPDKAAFSFFSQGDGVYWLRVAMLTKSGFQEPNDKVLQKPELDATTQVVVIDTLRPIVKALRAARDGDEVNVTWEVQEDNFDYQGIRLDYQVKDAPPTALWTPISIVPGLTGNARFQSNTKQPIAIRISVLDKAKNYSESFAETGSGLAAVGFTNPGEPLPPKDPPTLPGNLQLPKRPADEIKSPIGPPPLPVAPPPMKPLEEPKGQIDPPFGIGQKPLNVVPPAPKGTIDPPFGIGQKPLNVVPPAQGNPLAINPPPKDPVDKVVADTRAPVDPPKGSSTSYSGGPTNPIATGMPARRPLPALQYINSHSVTLEYEIKRFGPSGIGGIELWLTKNDGESWEQVADDEDAQSAAQQRQQRKYEFRDNRTDAVLPDGIYGLTLVVKSKAGLGKKPRPGDVPEMRIEIDSQPPVAQLFKPAADPQQPDQVLLRWNAEDKNLTANPITLEYAERREGPWLPIKSDLENTGRYSWKVTNAIPVQVYLRLRVRDKAGNEAVAATPQPQYVDLTEPEGALIRVQPATK